MWGPRLARTTQTRPEEPGWEGLTRYLQKNHTVLLRACVPHIPTPRRKCGLTLVGRTYWGKLNEIERYTAEPYQDKSLPRRRLFTGTVTLTATRYCTLFAMPKGRSYARG